MKIQLVKPDEFKKLINRPQFIDNINDNIYIMKGLYSSKEIDDIKQNCLDFAKINEPKWHPCIDNFLIIIVYIIITPKHMLIQFSTLIISTHGMEIVNCSILF
jgi:hypothetical protein